MTTIPPNTPASQLRTGFTTGACSAAAAKGAALMLVHQTTVREVSITLPRGEIATFQLHGQHFSADAASCHVVKDAGDDPDVTNGAEVHASVQRNLPQTPVQNEGGAIIISGGEGIGKVTKPGLAIPAGEWAINPVPRRMIEESVACALFATPEARTLTTDSFLVTISIPDGEERSKRPSMRASASSGVYPSWARPASCARFRPRPGPIPSMRPWMWPRPADAPRWSFPRAGPARWRHKNGLTATLPPSSLIREAVLSSPLTREN